VEGGGRILWGGGGGVRSGVAGGDGGLYGAVGDKRGILEAGHGGIVDVGNHQSFATQCHLASPKVWTLADVKVGPIRTDIGSFRRRNALREARGMKRSGWDTRQ